MTCHNLLTTGSLLVLATFSLAACGKDQVRDDSSGGASSGVETDDMQVKTMKLDVLGGTLDMHSAKLVFPEGCVKKVIDVKVTEMGDGASMPSTASTMSLIGHPMMFEPHGTTFEKKVAVEMEAPGMGASSKAAVLRLDDENDKTWQTVPDAEFKDGKASFTISAFSIYAIFEDPEGVAEELYGAANPEPDPDPDPDPDAAVCGNGTLETGEDCDEPIDSAVCNGPDAGAMSCKTPTCGDGYQNINAGELCDDGNTEAGDGCSADCTSDESCGNLILDTATGEICDDGNTVGDDSCAADCLDGAVCGNGSIESVWLETCDVTEDDADCNGPDAPIGTACTAPLCGDDYANAAAGEGCDSGGIDTASCNGLEADLNACQPPVCGDYYANPAAGEECDEGIEDGLQCNGADAGVAACKISICGDAYVNSYEGEECDPGATDSPSCNGPDADVYACRASSCGDGYVNTAAGEECDTGDDAETCNGVDAGVVACMAPICGDDYVNSAAGESCDDGNTDNGDGCDSDCAFEG